MRVNGAKLIVHSINTGGNSGVHKSLHVQKFIVHSINTGGNSGVHKSLHVQKPFLKIYHNWEVPILYFELNHENIYIISYGENEKYKFKIQVLKLK